MEFGGGSFSTRSATRRRSNQINHTAHNNLAHSIQAKCQTAAGFSASTAGLASPRPLLLLHSGLLPPWAGWFQTGRAGWRSSGWWCRLVSSSLPPDSPTWWTAFIHPVRLSVKCSAKLPATIFRLEWKKKCRLQRASGSGVCVGGRFIYRHFFARSRLAAPPIDLLVWSVAAGCLAFAARSRCALCVDFCARANG